MPNRQALNITITTNAREALEKMSKQYDRPMNWIVCKLIEKYALIDGCLSDSSLQPSQPNAIANQESTAVRKEQLERDLRIVNLINFTIKEMVDGFNSFYDGGYATPVDAYENIASLINDIKSQINDN